MGSWSILGIGFKIQFIRRSGLLKLYPIRRRRFSSWIVNAQLWKEEDTSLNDTKFTGQNPTFLLVYSLLRSNFNFLLNPPFPFMKYHLTTLTFFLIATLSFGQKEIKNSKNPSYQTIDGTKVSLVSPEGFTKAANFLGLQQTETQSSIMVMSIPGPTAQLQSAITKENLALQGVIASQIESMTINGLPAVWVIGSQQAQGMKFGKRLLILGTAQESVMLNAAFPENQENIGKSIEQSLLSVVFEPDQVIDPMTALDFRVELTDSKLKFGRAMGTTLIFTVDGQVPTASVDKTNLIVGKAISDTQPKDRRQFVINRINQTPIAVESMEYVREITVDGLAGYEILAKSKPQSNGKADLLYQVILFTDMTYYILFGTASDDQSLEEIKKVVGTFTRK